MNCPVKTNSAVRYFVRIKESKKSRRNKEHTKKETDNKKVRI
jgi:hypothetical protein